MKQIKGQLKIALNNVEQEIRDNHESAYGNGRAMSGEGYAGGYRDALYDITLALNDIVPSNSRYWPKIKFKENLEEMG